MTDSPTLTVDFQPEQACKHAPILASAVSGDEQWLRDLDAVEGDYCFFTAMGALAAGRRCD